MQQSGHLLPGINGLLKAYKVLLLAGIVVLSMNVLNSIKAQAIDPVQSIRDLREGYLIVRIPTSRAKINTLQAIVTDTTENSAKPRFQKRLDEAIEERDTLLSDYTRAFREVYNFSKVAYFFDYEAYDLRTAHFYNPDGTELPKEEIGPKPVFYMYFDRTKEGHIDALIIYDVEGQEIPAPFPNNFTRGGINFLFLKISSKSFATWRMERINKRLFNYWSENREP